MSSQQPVRAAAASAAAGEGGSGSQRTMPPKHLSRSMTRRLNSFKRNQDLELQAISPRSDRDSPRDRPAARSTASAADPCVERKKAVQTPRGTKSRLNESLLPSAPLFRKRPRGAGEKKILEKLLKVSFWIGVFLVLMTVRRYVAWWLIPGSMELVRHSEPRK